MLEIKERSPLPPHHVVRNFLADATFRICFGVCPGMIYRRRAATGMSSARLHSIKVRSGNSLPPPLSFSLALARSFSLGSDLSNLFSGTREILANNRQTDGREWFQTIGLRIWISFIYQQSILAGICPMSRAALVP